MTERILSQPETKLGAGNRRRISLIWLVLLTLAFLAGFGFFGSFALPYLLLDAQVLDRFEGRWFWILSHVGAGSVALLVGPFQLWLGVTGNTSAWHRRLGTIYLLSIVVSSLTSFYLAATTQMSWVFGLGLAGLGLAWLITTGLGYYAILKRQFVQHQEWMIRSFVVTLGFVFFRIFMGVMSGLDVGTLLERLNAASWFCWAIPLLLTEAVIQGRKLRLQSTLVNP